MCGEMWWRCWISADIAPTPTPQNAKNPVQRVLDGVSLVSPEGIEPSTSGLRVRCSAWLS